MFLLFDTKVKITIKTWPTTPTHDYDAANPDTQFVGFEAELPANSEQSFNAYFTPSADIKIRSEPLAKWQVTEGK
jgi:hypothetical protein